MVSLKTWEAMKNSIFGLTSNLRIPFEHLFDSKSWEKLSNSRSKDFPYIRGKSRIGNILERHGEIHNQGIHVALGIRKRMEMVLLLVGWRPNEIEYF